MEPMERCLKHSPAFVDHPKDRLCPLCEVNEMKTFTHAALAALGNQIAELEEATNDLWHASERSVGGDDECERITTIQIELRLSIAETLGVPHLGFKLLDSEPAT